MQASAARPEASAATQGRWAPRKSSSYFPNARRPPHAVNQVGTEDAQLPTPAPDLEDPGLLDEGAHDLDRVPGDPETQPVEAECPPELEDQEHLAMAAFHKAKTRVLEVRKARG